MYAQFLIEHSSSIFRNIGLHFSLKCPKTYILPYQFIKLDKNYDVCLTLIVISFYLKKFENRNSHFTRIGTLKCFEFSGSNILF